MARWLFFFALVGAVTAYSFWVYLRVDLSVPAARGLALVRTAALVTVFALLFDVRVPTVGAGGTTVRWVLLDASLSMSAGGELTSAWKDASERARQLELEGWKVVRFGEGTLELESQDGGEADERATLLSPALAAVAEAGAHEVRVLSDLRLEDPVAVRAALTLLPLEVVFEGFGRQIANAGIVSFDVPDLAQPQGRLSAELEVHGGAPGDSVALEILEEGRIVATTSIVATSPGLRSRVTVRLPTPSQSGRVRYSARISMDGDAFGLDDAAVAYANIGHEEGALVLVSFEPDWEPRYLLPVLGDVTGLPTVGYLRAGRNRFVRLGPAIERGEPADVETVRRAAAEAAILVVHGLGASADGWIKTLVTLPGRRLLLPADTVGAALFGIDIAAPRGGEWYASSDIPTSPIAGALAGVPLQGLPPLTDVMIPVERSDQPPLRLQLRGVGAPQPAMELIDRPTGRVVIVLASGFWRWAMRDTGVAPYRRLWSGIVGWLLADEEVVATSARPETSVVARGDPVRWSVPGDGVRSRILVAAGDSVVVDTVVDAGSSVLTRVLPPGSYSYLMLDQSGDTAGSGRFDVSGSTLEMLPVAAEPHVSPRNASLGVSGDIRGRPLHTFSWPYLLVIALLCGEWIVRRRSGLR